LVRCTRAAGEMRGAAGLAPTLVHALVLFALLPRY